MHPRRIVAPTITSTRKTQMITFYSLVTFKSALCLSDDSRLMHVKLNMDTMIDFFTSDFELISQSYFIESFNS